MERYVDSSLTPEHLAWSEAFNWACDAVTLRLVRKHLPAHDIVRDGLAHYACHYDEHRHRTEADAVACIQGTRLPKRVTPRVMWPDELCEEVVQATRAIMQVLNAKPEHEEFVADAVAHKASLAWGRPESEGRDRMNTYLSPDNDIKRLKLDAENENNLIWHLRRYRQMPETIDALCRCSRLDLRERLGEKAVDRIEAALFQRGLHLADPNA